LAINETSGDPQIPAVQGVNTALGDGVVGRGLRGVVGESPTFQGVFGHSDDNAGVVGESTNFHAVFGISHSPHDGGTRGTNDAGGFGAIGIIPEGKLGIGVQGDSPLGDGVVGNGHRGVVGRSLTFQGVFGHSVDNAGVVGESTNFDAVFGNSHSSTHAGIFGTNDAGGFAGVFDGRVSISGDCLVRGDVKLTGGDLAEDFGGTDLDNVEAGTVMVLEGIDRVRVSDAEYDRRVAGVITGAGLYRPGVILDHKEDIGNRHPLALVGKVFCKVDAFEVPISIGDLLTTSSTPGHAMKAVDPVRAFGAVIGKAMGSCAGGTGLIPILVALH
jgi:hypothetical protein